MTYEPFYLGNHLSGCEPALLTGLVDKALHLSEAHLLSTQDSCATPKFLLGIAAGLTWFLCAQEGGWEPYVQLF